MMVGIINSVIFAVLSWNMKNVLLLISFLFVLLFASKAMNGLLLPVTDEVEECMASYEQSDSYSIFDGTTGCILSVSSSSPYNDMTIADAQTLARQLRVMGRTQRSVSFHCSFISKAIGWRTAFLRMKELSLSSQKVYTSLPRLSWEVSSDHYIFGMRRILI